MKTSAVLLLCLAWARALPHHHVEDIDLEHRDKEGIEMDMLNIDVGEAKTKLQEAGEDILDEFEKQLVDKSKHYVDNMLGRSNQTKLEVSLEKTEKDVKDKFEEIKEDLPTIVNQLVEGSSQLTKSEMEVNLNQLRKVIKMNVNGKIYAMCFKNVLNLNFKSQHHMKHQHMGDTKLEQEVKKRIQRKVSDIEVCGPKTTLQDCLSAAFSVLQMRRIIRARL